MAEREGFEPSVSKKDTHDFQSCLFSQLQHLSTETDRDPGKQANTLVSMSRPWVCHRTEFRAVLHGRDTPFSTNIKIQ